MSVANATRWETVIGLEVHVQLATASKMYCACAVEETQELSQANRHVCPVCLGHPGTLPRPNRQAIVRALSFGLKAGAEIAERSVFARKNYFYPDLPKGYQISQFDLPLLRGGSLPYWHNGAARTASLVRAHLEEDTAKLFHLPDGTAALDYSRSGVPLLEIVSEPCFSNAAECISYLDELRSLLRRLGVSDAAMESGNMRCEPNVSVRPVGSVELRTKTEIKNLNSFTVLRRAVEAETARQIALYESGGEVYQATMRFDPDRGETVQMRRKETADDYRYFDDPDIPPLVLSPALLDEARGFLHSSAFEDRKLMVEQDGISAEAAAAIADDEVLHRFYRICSGDGYEAKTVANWVTGELTRLMREAPLHVEPGDLSEVLSLLKAGSLTLPQAREVFASVYSSGRTVKAVVDEAGFGQRASGSELREICQQVIAANEKVVADIRGGKTAALQVLVGQVMKQTRGSASPEEIKALMNGLLGL